ARTTTSSYSLDKIQPLNAGGYSVVASNSAGTASSMPAILTVLSPPFITTGPQSRSVRAGSNVLFTVAANGTAPLAYQWQFNGRNLPEAVGSSYAVKNVQITNAGTYTVLISNVTRIVATAAAGLYVDSPLMFANSILSSYGHFQGQLIGFAATNY